MRSDMPRRHLWFALLCVASGGLFWRPLSALASLAWKSDYYTHTVIVPLLVGYLIYKERGRIFKDIHGSFGFGILLLFTGILLYGLTELVFKDARLLLAIFSIVLFWIGAFALCYGLKTVRAALFPLFLLFLTVPLPMAEMDWFMQSIRAGSAEVASAIFTACGVPVFRNGFYFFLPGVSIEIAKECSGIHSTLALLVLSLVAGYMFLRSTWKRGLLVLLVVPIVSLTNGLRIATLTLLAAYVDKNILRSSLHRDGGILFFMLALSLLVAIIHFVSGPEEQVNQSHPSSSKSVLAGN